MESPLAFKVEQHLPDYDLLLQRAFYTKVQMVEVNREFRYLHFTFFIRAIFWSAVLFGCWDVSRIFLDGLPETAASWVFAILLLSFIVWSIAGHLHLIRAKKHARSAVEAKTEQQYPFDSLQAEESTAKPQEASSDRFDAAKWLWAQPGS